MNAEAEMASAVALRRAWLQEIGIEWRGPLPAPILVQTPHAASDSVSDGLEQVVALAAPVAIAEVDTSVNAETPAKFETLAVAETSATAEAPALEVPSPPPPVGVPAQEPERRTPEVDEPPQDQPPVEDPEPEVPPAKQPPADDPAVEDPPHDQPPGEEPPSEQPPIEEPEHERAPIGDPPTQTREFQPVSTPTTRPAAQAAQTARSTQAVNSQAVRPAAQAAVQAEAQRRARVKGAWRWSWWQAMPQAAYGPERALLLRPASAPLATDAQARELLAAALKAIGLQPVPRRKPTLGGVWRDGVDLAWLQQCVQQYEQDGPGMKSRTSTHGQDGQSGAVPVIWCLPLSQRTLLTSVLEQPHAVPGTRWPLAGPLPLQLVLVPAPEDMLTDPALKRVAWQALSPLRG